MHRPDRLGGAAWLGLVAAACSPGTVGSPGEQPPVPAAVDDAYETPQDALLAVSAARGLTANDPGFDARRMLVQIETVPAHGDVQVQLDGGFTYTPASLFVGADGFTYSIAHGDGLETAPATVFIDVTPLPGSPTAAADSYALDEDGTLSAPSTSGVLANDTDPEGAALTALLVDPPSHGMLSLAADGSFVYAPDSDFFGADSFTYSASDGALSSMPVAVQLTVHPQADPPDAAADDHTTDEDAPLAMAAAEGVLANDVDPDGDAVTAVLETPPAHGTLALEVDGSFLYIPEPDFNGADSFRYRASDGLLESSSVTVALTITAVNDAPQATDTTVTVVQGRTVTGLLGASDVEGDAMTFRLVSPPAHGTALVGATSGGFRYTAGDTVGPDAFTFAASDGLAESAAATVTLDVIPPPPPEIVRIFPERGTTGRPLQIWGRWLGAAPGAVNIDGRDAEVRVWTEGYVTAIVPFDYEAGVYDVVVTDDRLLDSAAVPYEIVPWVVALDPEIGLAGASLVASGDSLGPTAGTVSVAGTAAAVDSWSNRAVGLTLPAGVTPGLWPVALTTAAGLDANQVTVTVPGPGMWVSHHYPTHGGGLVWTGTELLLWSGSYYGGSRYDPVADRWTRMSTVDAPPAVAPAVWTGSELIVWSGTVTWTPYYHWVVSGGRYDPVTDTWRPMTSAGEPGTRVGHSLVWTGTEVLVWGGKDDDVVLADGGRYDPAADTWSEIATAGAPAARWRHSTVWTGSHMIIWGGDRDTFTCCDPTGVSTGGRYDPAADTWQATSLEGAPAPRWGHAAAWIGAEMLVVGGGDDDVLSYKDGGRYDPLFDAWTAIPAWTASPPTTTRSNTEAVWTGTDLALWDMGQGRRYDPVASAWSDLPAGDGAGAAMAWTGADLMRITSTNDFLITERLETVSRSWVELATMVRDTRSGHSTVWTGSELVIWGGDAVLSTGVRYDPMTDTWAPTSPASAPAARQGHTAVWTSSEMIIWGGRTAGSSLDSGGRWSPGTDTWASISTANAPSARSGHTAVWTGSEMIIWGGGSNLNTGALYDPATDTWRPTSLSGAPAGRAGHTAVWTGSEMIVWGVSSDGALYDPAADTWRPMSPSGAPAARTSHSAVWTGSAMVIWGGTTGFATEAKTGASYDPVTDTWTATSTVGAPEARMRHVAVWTGSRMLVFGGEKVEGGTYYMNDAASWDPDSNTWTALPALHAPPAGPGYSGAWTGTVLVVAVTRAVAPSGEYAARYLP